MTTIIRIVDKNFYNSNNYGLVFTSTSNIKQYCRDNNIYYDLFLCINPDNIHEIKIDNNIINNKINILEYYNIYGELKETLIYDNNIDELLKNCKERMIVELKNEKYPIIDVILTETTINLLDGSVAYEINYNKVINSNNEEITHFLCEQKIRLITNIPIISYENIYDKYLELAALDFFGI